jgi:hypothetical protein
MTQWSTYAPYDTSYMPSDGDRVDSTRLVAARVVSGVVIVISTLLIAGHYGLVGLNAFLALTPNHFTF